MNDRVAFYGTFTLPKTVLERPAFANIWNRALDSYDQEKLEWGITEVYSTTDMGDAISYEVGGLTEAGFAEAASHILEGSLNPEEIETLYHEFETAKVALTYDINEHFRYADAPDGLERQTGALVVFDKKPQLKDVEVTNMPITSARLVDMGFANASEFDDEELAVMISALYPDGPNSDNLVDAIEDVREDADHEGVFTEEETEDPLYFAELINSASAAEMDIE